MSTALQQATDRTVLVTGAGKRLGRAMALGLASAGWRVAVHYRHSQPEAEQTVLDCNTQCAGAQSFQADLSDESATKGAVTKSLPCEGIRPIGCERWL
jgi:NAD(P)-dependent dehydrogenase (short-subunit alcohol dehydrogenase family)